MSLVKKLVKEIALVPVRVVQGVVEAVDETFNIIEGREKKPMNEPTTEAGEGEEK